MKTEQLTGVLIERSREITLQRDRDTVGHEKHADAMARFNGTMNLFSDFFRAVEPIKGGVTSYFRTGPIILAKSVDDSGLGRGDFIASVTSVDLRSRSRAISHDMAHAFSINYFFQPEEGEGYSRLYLASGKPMEVYLTSQPFDLNKPRAERLIHGNMHAYYIPIVPQYPEQWANADWDSVLPEVERRCLKAEEALAELITAASNPLLNEEVSESVRNSYPCSTTAR